MQAVQMKLLDETYLGKIMELQTKIEKNITQKRLLEPLTMQQYLDMLKERGKIIGCFEEERLIAFFGIWYPWQEEDNLAVDIGLEQSEYNKVAHLEISMVDNDFRGKKLHAKMLAFMIELLKKENQYSHICATVSPYNPWSFVPLLKQNMHIVALKKKYGGKLRYILYSNLQKERKAKCVYKKNVDMEDLQTQYKLLMDGYEGIDVIKQGEKTFIIFEKE